MLKVLTFIGKTFNVLLMFGIVVNKNSLPGDKRKKISNLDPRTQVIGRNSQTTSPHNGATYYKLTRTLPIPGNGLVSILMRRKTRFLFCATDFAPPCITSLYHFGIMLYGWQLGIHSRCLGEWEHPLGETDGSFMRLKFIIPIEALRRKGKETKLFFSMGKWSFLGGTWTGGGGSMEAVFLITLLKMVKTLFLIRTRESLVRRTNGRGTSRAAYVFDKVFASFSLLTRKNLHTKKMHVN